MSREKAAVKNAESQQPTGKTERRAAAGNKSTAVEEIAVTSLQIDESYEVDSDPYNSTGKFLAEALRAKRGD